MLGQLIIRPSNLVYYIEDFRIFGLTFLAFFRPLEPFSCFRQENLSHKKGKKALDLRHYSAHVHPWL